MSNSLEELAERLLDVSQQGQQRLAELRAATENSLQLQQQLLAQADEFASQPPPQGDGNVAGEVDAELEAEVLQLREELQWTRSQLLTARDQLENDQPGGADESELLTELEQAKRQVDDLRRDLADANERLELAPEPVDVDTDVVAARDATIADLQAQLEALQARATDEPSVDRFASSEEIAAEREALRTLQEEWHGKLRGAELEISIERAKMARERSEMEERVNMMESELRLLQETDTKGTSKGKWFARLGLKED